MAVGVVRSAPDPGGRSPSDRADDPVGLQALGAHVEALGRPIDQGAHALDVRIPPAVGANVRVRHALAEAGSLTAHVTNGSHDDLLGCQNRLFPFSQDSIERCSPPQATMKD